MEHNVLLEILEQYIPDKQIVRLLTEIIYSFETRPGEGLPLGNLTSQLFVNIYMNQFDQHVKHQLKARHYIRYADDFVFLSVDKKQLENLVPEVREFLWNRLKLRIHSDKVKIQTLSSGIDYLGWVHFPDHRVLRPRTKQRMLKRVASNPGTETLQSYLGLLSHGHTSKLTRKVYKSYILGEN